MNRFLSLVTFLFAILSAQPVFADDCGDRYREKVFAEYDFVDNEIYAVKQTSSGEWQNLGYDVYMPANDPLAIRPVIMLAHGGGYIDFIDQKSPDIVRLAEEFVLRGYVVISVEYREEASALSLFSTENMVKAVGRALIDIRDATCFIMDLTLNQNNPYRADPDNVIVGGVSAGAVSFLQAVFLDSIDWVPPQFEEWILEVEPNTQALLDNKYCGANVKGLINISGALLDTSWIKGYKADEYPAMMHVHGGLDPIVPYAYDHPFGLQILPKLMGSSLIDARAQNLGIRSELDYYPSQGHVPILGLNWNALLSDDPVNFIFNERIMNATLDHMTDFCYSMINCHQGLILAVDENKTRRLNTYPNPSNGNFTVMIPSDIRHHTGQLEFINTMGQIIHSRTILPYEANLFISEDLPPGLYQMRYTAADVEDAFTGQVLIAR